MGLSKASYYVKELGKYEDDRAVEWLRPPCFYREGIYVTLVKARKSPGSLLAPGAF